MSFNIRRLEGCFEGVSQKYFKNFFLAPSMDSRMDLISLPSRRAISRRDTPAPLPELMDRKKRDIMERKGDKEDENKRQKQQKESSAAAL